METGVLYIVATPIGNMGDVTFRAIETLKKVDFIICEDTRKTKILMDNYNIVTSLTSFYKGQKTRTSFKPIPKADYFIEELKNGKNIALVTDAGTPGISDPGNQLVEKAVEKNIKVIPIPGASSLTALISVSGIDMSKFVFLGFPPHKKGREKFFKEAIGYNYPVAYLDSVHRVLKNLELLEKLLENLQKKIIIGRELTKIFEEIVRGSAGEVLEYFKKNSDKIKGEFVIIIY